MMIMKKFFKYFMKRIRRKTDVEVMGALLFQIQSKVMSKICNPQDVYFRKIFH